MTDFLKNFTKITSVLLAVCIAFFNTVLKLGNGSGSTTTTTKSSSESSSSSSASSTSDAKGTFTIVSYGWGHGVGMSQQGAIAMAKAGNGYVTILKHYYTGTSVYRDTSTPKTIKYGDKDMELIQFLCQTTKQEIGDGSPKAAIQAQAAAIYSFAKYYSYKVKTTQIAISSNYSYKGTSLYSYILEYLNMNLETDTPQAGYISADKGKTAALAVFCDSVAGRTANATDIWGGTYSYLVPVDSYEEVDRQDFKISAADMEDLIYNYNPNINLDENPAKWFSNIKHDACLTANIGYITSITVGNKTMKGNTFRENVMKNKIKSPCCTITYSAS